MATVTTTQRPWRVHGVSVQGYSHLRDGVECQDAYRHMLVGPGPVQVLAVADGAGSRPRSAEGAALAVGLANRLLAERLRVGRTPASAGSWRSLLSSAYEEILATFLSATERMGSDPSEFAATLTVVIIAPPWLGVISIGDGFVITRADTSDGGDGFHLVASALGTEEYVNDTVFLTSRGAQTEVTIDCVYDPGLTAVLLSTDGLIPVAIRQQGGRRRANRTFLEPVLDGLNEPAEIARLLLDDRISGLSADDKTLLMAVCS
jgi:hypothetical protein